MYVCIYIYIYMFSGRLTQAGSHPRGADDASTGRVPSMADLFYHLNRCCLMLFVCLFMLLCIVFVPSMAGWIPRPVPFSETRRPPGLQGLRLRGFEGFGGSRPQGGGDKLQGLQGCRASGAPGAPGALGAPGLLRAGLRAGLRGP